MHFLVTTTAVAPSSGNIARLSSVFAGDGTPGVFHGYGSGSGEENHWPTKNGC